MSEFTDFNAERLPGPGFYVLLVPSALPQKTQEVFFKCTEICDHGDSRYSFFATTENKSHPETQCDCGRYYWIDTPRGFYSRVDHPLSWRRMTKEEIEITKSKLFSFNRPRWKSPSDQGRKLQSKGSSKQPRKATKG